MFDRPLTKLAAGLFALGACAGACTAALDFTECRDDSDCSQFFVADKPMQCSNFQCVEGDGCSGNTACEGLGDGYVCTVLGTCVQVEADGCMAPVYPEGQASDEVVLVGSIVALDGPDKAAGEAVDKAIRKAVEDFNASWDLQGKAVALVPCDSKGDVAAARAAAFHLGDKLAVPVILGPLADDEFYDVIQNVSTENGIRAFTHSPTASAELKDLNDSSLGWQTAVAARYQGRAVGLHIAYEQQNNVFLETETKPSAAFLFNEDDKFGYAMYYAIATTDDPNSVVNRIPEASGQQTSSYRDVETAITKLEEFLDKGETEVLILFGGPEVAELLQYWSGTSKPWPTRVYIAGPSAAAVQALALADANLVERLRLIAPDFGGEAALAIQERVGSTRGEAVLAYDAAMATFLAMAAIPEGNAIVGPNVVKQMPKLSIADGTPVAFADDPATFVKAARDTLASGDGVSITGGSGNLDWQADGTLCDALAAFTFDGTAFTLVDRFTPDCPSVGGSWAPNN
jgi:hypothetical protein